MPSETDRLFVDGMNVLQVVARRIARRLGRRVPVEDLLAIGRAALLDVVRSYDPSRSSFPTYARVKLTWAVLEGVRRESRWRSERSWVVALAASEQYAEATRQDEITPIDPQEDHQQQFGDLLAGHAAAMVLGLMAARDETDPGIADEGESPEERTAAAELAVAVRRAVEHLPERERALIERHYYGGERFDHIAEDLGISKSRASRLHAQGIAALSRALREEED
ncbi:MAG TPA: sigma-70 family RNA polymerase sigma factor [Candidatus Nanopelagicales bacterium]|nr:sigma-70 family RNA polymerase sigma factor [Candidatus Nanopelagicales bacterium]